MEPHPGGPGDLQALEHALGFSYRRPGGQVVLGPAVSGFTVLVDQVFDYLVVFSMDSGSQAGLPYPGKGFEQMAVVDSGENAVGRCETRTV